MNPETEQAPVISVRVRHEDDEESTFLCTWPVTCTAALLATLRERGLYYNGDDRKILAGRFVIEDDRPYFEVVVGDG
jgi:hypothetical protein